MSVINDIKSVLMSTEDNHVFAKRLLMSIYADCKDITNALKVFDSIPQNQQDFISISSMMKYCVNQIIL